MATLGNPVNVGTAGNLAVGIANELKAHYFNFLLPKLEELQQTIGTTNLQTAAGITDSNEVFQVNSLLAALLALKACYENGLAQPGFNITQFCESLIGDAG